MSEKRRESGRLQKLAGFRPRTVILGSERSKAAQHGGQGAYSRSRRACGTRQDPVRNRNRRPSNRKSAVSEECAWTCRGRTRKTGLPAGPGHAFDYYCRTDCLLLLLVCLSTSFLLLSPSSSRFFSSPAFSKATSIRGALGLFSFAGTHHVTCARSTCRRVTRYAYLPEFFDDPPRANLNARGVDAAWLLLAIVPPKIWRSVFGDECSGNFALPLRCRDEEDAV